MHTKNKPYYSDEGSTSGSKMMRIIPVFESGDYRKHPIGIARMEGYLPKRRELVRVFRLTVRGEKWNGLWACQGQQFVRVAGDE
jgi:hypothetical protein